MKLKDAITGWWTRTTTPATPGRPRGTAAEREEERKRERSLITKLNRRYTYRGLLEMDRLVRAIVSAESIQNPSRMELYAIYRQVELDDQVTAQQRVALIALQRAPFDLLDAGGQPSEQLHDLLEEPWFADVLRFHLEAEWWGHSLLEFETAPDGTFERVHLVPRDHVIPEWGLVVQEPGARSGYSFRQNPAAFPLLEAGGPEDLGVLHKVAIPVVRKRYSDEDWSMYSERFGMPLLDIGTDTRDTKEIERLERFAAEFGRNGYVIRGLTDEVQFQQPTTNGMGHHIYRDRIDYADRQIAKLLNGQTSTSDEKAFVGAAEVHERILDDFSFGRLRRLAYWLNTYFFPFAAAHGYPQLAAARIAFTELRQQDREDGRASVKGKGETTTTEEKPGAESVDGEGDDPAPRPPGKPKAGRGAQLSAGDPGDVRALMATDELTLLYYGSRGLPAEMPELSTFAMTRDQLAATQARIAALAAAPRAEAEWDRQTFDHLWPDYEQALKNGWGHDWDSIDRTAKGWESLHELRRNTVQLAAGKTTRMIRKYREIAAGPGGRASADAYIESSIRYFHQAELAHVTACARAQVKWRQLKAEQGLFPLLEYRTTKDERVRDAHKLLDGIVRPLTDDFWKAHYPPNGYGCRCYVRQQDANYPETPKDNVPPVEQTDTPPEFRFNPGQDGLVFAKGGEHHPYFAKTGTAREVALEELADSSLNRYEPTGRTSVSAHVLRHIGTGGLPQWKRELDAASELQEANDRPVRMRYDDRSKDSTRATADFAVVREDGTEAIADVKHLTTTVRRNLKDAVGEIFRKQGGTIAVVHYEGELLPKRLGRSAGFTAAEVIRHMESLIPPLERIRLHVDGRTVDLPKQNGRPNERRKRPVADG